MSDSVMEMSDQQRENLSLLLANTPSVTMADSFNKFPGNSCAEQMQIGPNKECGIHRRIVSGLGGCLCNKTNCPKLR